MPASETPVKYCHTRRPWEVWSFLDSWFSQPSCFYHCVSIGANLEVELFRMFFVNYFPKLIQNNDFE